MLLWRALLLSVLASGDLQQRLYSAEFELRAGRFDTAHRLFLQCTRDNPTEPLAHSGAALTPLQYT